MADHERQDRHQGVRGRESGALIQGVVARRRCHQLQHVCQGTYDCSGAKIIGREATRGRCTAARKVYNRRRHPRGEHLHRQVDVFVPVHSGFWEWRGS